MDNMNINENSENTGFSSQDKKGIALVGVLLIICAVMVSFCMKAGDNKAEVTLSESLQATVFSENASMIIPEGSKSTYSITTDFIQIPSENRVTLDGVITTVSEKYSFVSGETETKEQTTKKDIESTKTTAEKLTAKVELPVKPGNSEKDILDKITEGINSLQSDKASFKGTKKQVIYIQLNDCSVPVLTGTINSVLEHFAGEEITEYDFTNGKAIDPETGEEITSIHAIPPTDKLFTLTMDGVADAVFTETEKGTKYTVTVVPETSTLENPRPPHHNAAGDTLDFSAFELPVGEITKADFEYPGATVSVTIDKSGKIVEYHERLNMKGTGEGNALGISASGEMEGYIDEVWEIEWK